MKFAVAYSNSKDNVLKVNWNYFYRIFKIKNIWRTLLKVGFPEYE